MKTTSRTRNVLKWSAVPAGILASGLLVLGFSNAAFTATTTNTANNWATGNLALDTTNPANAPLFSTLVNTTKGAKDTVLVPGQTLTNNIDVNYTGNIGAEVRLYATPGTDTGIAQYLNVSVSAAGSPVWSGKLSTMPTTYAGAAAETNKWTPASTGTKNYTITVTLDPAAPDTAAVKGQSVTGTVLTWEAQTP